MAKTINSMCLTTILMIIFVISTGIPKSEAACFTFKGECSVTPPCSSSGNCKTCCQAAWGSGACGKCELEGSELHCHCYT
ncbi:unnamed protein product [Arabidopsis lyrata]|uniref:Uncharacterized protein n=1 Tax=Arabidopsis lyrata subsp. lyrata TaxID=81972 RepID=D7LIY0_ARALL|nr:hypothetical protein ARALYDRAFT_901065 [Arabidopsis lyrata subsp. lyrata]CAH8263436.1 unnamed protein product [Arabidopsis lyrata]